MSVYYNEFDLDTAEWLRELIMAGVIADGVIDTRSIEDVRPADLEGFTQCHFFAGIGVWSYALRAAGWPDDRPVWTGSCPCQPFSAAGKGIAFADERHLWPAFHHLIKVRKPECVIGEQVASAAVDPWIDLVHADLEALGYAFGSVPFPSAGVGAPHIRDRNYWVADANMQRQPTTRNAARIANTDRRVEFGRVGDTDHARLEGQRSGYQAAGRWVGAIRPAAPAGKSGGVDNASSIGQQAGGDVDRGHDRDQLAATGELQLGRLAHTDGGHTSAKRQQRRGQQRQQPQDGGSDQLGARAAANGHVIIDMASGAGPTNGFWRDADWLGCRDGKWRPVEPGTFPLVTGAAARVVRLRGYGNAINAKAAQVWIETVMECQP